MQVNAHACQTRLAHLFLQRGTRIYAAKGRLLQLRGHSEQTLYYLSKGHVLLHLSSFVGKELAVDVLGPGALIGLGALRAEPSHHLDATTFSECTLHCLPANILKFELFRDPQLCAEVFNWANDQLGRRASQLEELALINLDGRIARVLINQFDALGVPLQTGAEAPIPSQKILSTLVGGSRESVNKELRRLHEREIIAVSRQKVRILDAVKLKQQAEPSAIPYWSIPR
jgi:CRP/FNR family cyclic AMP-dependent transcriptional regulator